MTVFIHQLKGEKGWSVSRYTLLGICLFIYAGIEVDPGHQKGIQCH